VHGAGGEVWATVTNAAEGRAARMAGADALVAQGAEAGGHRGSWADDDGPDLELHALLSSIDASLPVIAAGGIADADGAAAALTAGAAAVQAGTAFMLCPEAATAAPHRRALATDGETAMTRAFTGRRARGIVNEFMRSHPDAPRGYPHVHYVTAPLRAAARAAGDLERINLWAGTGYHRAEARPAASIVAALSP
jgi:nitronate monooxygenase